MSGIDEILAGKYPAKAHAEKVAEYIRKEHPEVIDGLIYLESAKQVLHEDSDQEAPIRQRRPFFYLTGCPLPNSYVTYSLSTKQLTLYIPPINPADVVWSGLPLSPEQALSHFDVDRVFTTVALDADIALSPSTLFTIATQVSRALPTTAHPSGILRRAIDAARVFKDPYEIALIKRANSITTRAHHAAMASIKTAANEREVMAVFTHACIAGGAPKQAYTGIFGSGRNASTLHYIHNDQPLAGRLNLLLDAGAELQNYASDVTRTFPISGKFSAESRAVYDTVLRMQERCMQACKAGVMWDDVHVLAHRVAIEGLLEMGVMKGGTVDEILGSRTSCAFLPHGLGHYLGMDTHDVGGDADYADKDPMFCYLRKRGPLAEGAVITVEPGIYFCEYIIRPFLDDPVHSKYIDAEVLERYWDVGGVRIEDNILITSTGYENLTTAAKSVDEMEAIINHA